MDNVGKYRILRLIGEGGMSSVYAAEHELLGTKAAVKVLKPELSVNPQIRERFRNEARHMALLNHPNITTVVDFDEQPKQLSIVMELLEGEDLGTRIRRTGTIGETELGEIFGKVLAALQYAHDNGIVHRDIKPSNIFLTSDGQVKLLDFGIAKVYGQGQELTLTGQQMGTPVYMSPEQVRSDKSIDHRTDIYSLGVTMFFAVIGRPPYDAASDSQFDIFNKIVYEPIPALIVGGRLQQMIQKACAKDPTRRFQHCREWMEMLENHHDISGSGNMTLVWGEQNKQDASMVNRTPLLDSKNNNPAVSIDGDSKKNGAAKTGYVLGIISLIAWLIPLLGVTISIIGIVKSVHGQKSENKRQAKAGQVMNIIGLLFAVINSLIGAYLGYMGKLF